MAPPFVSAIIKSEDIMNSSSLNDFSDIINLPRPASKHPKMPLEKRAKQFAPFAALGELEESESIQRK